MRQSARSPEPRFAPGWLCTGSRLINPVFVPEEEGAIELLRLSADRQATFTVTGMINLRFPENKIHYAQAPRYVLPPASEGVGMRTLARVSR